MKKAAMVIVLIAAVAAVMAIKRRGSEPAKPASVSAEHPAAPVGVETSKALPRLVDLGADKCVPCRMMAPILEELKTTQADRLTVEFIDVWKNPGAGQQYGIRVIPTQIFYDTDGNELFRHEGFYSKEDILGKCKELGMIVMSNE